MSGLYQGLCRAAIVVFLSFSFCAKQGFPPGGPEDETAPAVVLTNPEAGLTDVDPETRIDVWFSEGVVPSSNEAIFISPYPGDDVRYRFHGKHLEILLPGPLEKNRTYVVTLGTGIKDYRNNAMKTSYTLAFSTGPVIDQGEIAGKVFGEKDSRGIGIWVYRLSGEEMFDPLHTTPDYIGQCSQDGSFRLTHISPGQYRLLTLRDRYSDRLYQPGEDDFGVTWRDVQLQEDNILAEDLFFRMSLEDTTKPAMVKAVSLDNRTVILRFSEALSDELPDKEICITAVSDSLDTLRIEEAHLDPVSGQWLAARTAPMDSSIEYKVRVSGYHDFQGNPVDSAFSRAFFHGSALPDTVRPLLVKNIPAAGVKDVNLDVRIRLFFNELMNTDSSGHVSVLYDSTGEAVSGQGSWISLFEWIFTPEAPLMSRSRIRVSHPEGRMMDRSGNILLDTAFVFTTIHADTLSQMSGVLSDPLNENGSIIITASQINNKEIVYQDSVSGPGRYLIRNMLPGAYQIYAFLDGDGNGRYTHGKPFPFRFAERFAVMPDTVELRSRWFQEGNDFSLPDTK